MEIKFDYRAACQSIVNAVTEMDAQLKSCLDNAIWESFKYSLTPYLLTFVK